MIPVVMGNEQHVQLRQVFRPAYAGAGKGLFQEGKRRGMVAQDRIDQQAPAPKLHIPGTVPQPEDEVMGGQGAQIGFDDR